MNTTEVIKLGREALVMVLILGGPVLVASLIVGTIVALLQAVTQIHEATITFLPKLLIVGLVIASAGGWMMELMVGYTTRTFHNVQMLKE